MTVVSHTHSYVYSFKMLDIKSRGKTFEAVPSNASSLANRIKTTKTKSHSG